MGQTFRNKWHAWAPDVVVNRRKSVSGVSVMSKVKRAQQLSPQSVSPQQPAYLSTLCPLLQRPLNFNALGWVLGDSCNVQQSSEVLSLSSAGPAALPLRLGNLS